MRHLLVALMLLPAVAGAPDEGKKPGRPKRPAEALRKYGFLLPLPILERLDLSGGQKGKVLEALGEFAGKNARELDELSAERAEVREAMRKARADRDRAAMRKAQARAAELNERAGKLREQFEPRVLAVLGETQKQKYQELKKAGVARSSPPVIDRAALAKLKPLPELGTGEYKGFQGGLYPGGKNERPAGHEKAGLALARKVRPLDKEGKPDPRGKVVLLSIGMSNTTQEFSAFVRLAKGDPDKSPHLVLVDGAQGGMSAGRIVDPDDGRSGSDFWEEVDRRLKSAGVTRAQVQVVWIKQADPGPTQGFPRYARTLEEELAKIVRLLPKRFPNVKLAYLSCRTYGGYAKSRLNPEPYAYESGFSVKWLIGRQVKGEASLNYDSGKGKVVAPWLSWGPYLWANAKAKNSEGLSYEEGDFGPDGTHPSASGRRKVAEALLRFFKSDRTARAWFVKGG